MASRSVEDATKLVERLHLSAVVTIYTVIQLDMSAIVVRCTASRPSRRSQYIKTLWTVQIRYYNIAKNAFSCIRVIWSVRG